jgi:hypothetical protein
MRTRPLVSLVLLVALTAVELLVLTVTAEAASCSVTAERPWSGAPLPHGKIQGEFHGSCTGVDYVKTTTTLQLYVPAKRSWVQWAQQTTSPGPSNTYLGGGVQVSCTVGTTYLARTKAVMKGFDDHGTPLPNSGDDTVIATDSDGPTPQGGAFVTCR